MRLAAELALTVASNRLRRAWFDARCRSGAEAQRLSELLREGRARIEYARDRAQQSIRSVSRLLSASQPAWLSKLEDSLSQSARLQEQRLESAIQRRAHRWASRRFNPLRARRSRTEQARDFIVRRKRFRTLPLMTLRPISAKAIPMAPGQTPLSRPSIGATVEGF
jgi:hypothetical protein